MPGPRQPTDVVKANGKKHLSRAEEAQRRAMEVQVDSPDRAEPPGWLAKKFHKEFRELGERLLKAGLYTELDRDVLGQFLTARERWVRADKLASAAIRARDEKLAKEWTSVQGTYFKQCRQCAEAMGLSVTSRCRLVVPKGPGQEEEDNPFLKLMAGELWIVAEMIWLTPFIQISKPEDGAKLRYSQDAADRVFRFFDLLVFGQNEWAGEPFALMPWEKQSIREFYGVQVLDDDGNWVRYRRFIYDEIPKKNGKSEFSAGLGLYHLLADGEKVPNVGIFAADKTNADIIYKCAKYMVEHTAMSQPAHRPLVWCRDSVREIRTRFGGVMKVYSSDAESKHGFSFSAILIDELHAQQNRRLWDVLTAGSDAARRQQAVIVLTTAGDDPDRKSIGWEIHEKCRRILAWRRGEPERELDQDDPQWCPIMYGIGVLTGDDPDKIAALNIYDEELWKQCNPSYGVTIKPRQFRAEARAAQQSEAAERTFRWLRLNQWISTKSVGWLPLTLYDKTQWNRPEWKGLSVLERRKAVREYLRGKKCYGGLDLSKSTDLTAFVLIFPPQDGLETWMALFWAWRPEDGVLEAEQRDHVPYRDWARAGFLELCEGDIVDYSQVEETIWEASEQFDIQTLGLDPAMAWTLSQRLMAGDGEHQGLEVVQIPQTMMGLSPATKKLEVLIRAHEMLHEHNTCARWNFGNVRCAVDGNENMKPMKNRSTGRIDVTVAWIIAVATAMLKAAQPADLNDALESGEFTF